MTSSPPQKNKSRILEPTRFSWLTDRIRFGRSFRIQTRLNEEQILYVLSVLPKRKNLDYQFMLEEMTDTRPYRFQLSAVFLFLDRSSRLMHEQIAYIKAEILTDPNMTTSLIRGKVYLPFDQIFISIFMLFVFISGGFISFLVVLNRIQFYSLSGFIVFMLTMGLAFYIFPIGRRNNVLRILRDEFKLAEAGLLKGQPITETRNNT